MQALLVALLALFCGTTVEGQTNLTSIMFYVAPDGNETNGTMVELDADAFALILVRPEHLCRS